MSDQTLLCVRVTDSWYLVPRRYDTIWISRRKPLPWYDTLWISRRKPLPWYEVMWVPYMRIVSDLLQAGF